MGRKNLPYRFSLVDIENIRNFYNDCPQHSHFRGLGQSRRIRFDANR
jgi:hypothetical protein